MVGWMVLAMCGRLRCVLRIPGGVRNVWHGLVTLLRCFTEWPTTTDANVGDLMVSLAALGSLMPEAV